MKVCPNCKMTVDAHSECPVCKANITDVEYSEAKRESYKFNKYFFTFLLKKHWFPIICSIIALLVLVIRFDGFNIKSIFALFCMAESILVSLYRKAFINFDSKFYSESYSGLRAVIAIYGCSVAAILLAYIA